MSKAFVDFTSIFESGKLSAELGKELRVVEGTLNLRPSDTTRSGSVPSKTNLAVMAHLSLTVRKISAMLDQGLSYAAGDYYVYCQFSGVPSVTKGPNGMVRAMTNAAAKAGVTTIINVGCVFDNYDELKIVRNGFMDEFHLVNDPEYEIKQHNADDILAPYAVVTMLNKAGDVVSRKVTIVRQNEYHNARNQSKGDTHAKYPVPMAVKIPLRRAIDEMSAALGIADDDELAEVKADHDKDYDLTKAPEKTEAKKTLDDGKFKDLLPGWKVAIENGSTPAEIISGLENQYELPKKQRAAIEALADGE